MTDVVLVGHEVARVRLHRIADALRALGLSVEASCRPASGRLARLLRACSVPWTVRAKALVVVDPDLYWPAVLWRRRHGGAVVADVAESHGPLALRGARRANLIAVADAHLPPFGGPRLVVRDLPSCGPLPEPDVVDRPLRAVSVADRPRLAGLRTAVEAVLAVPDWELDVAGPLAPEEMEWADRRVDGCTRVRLHPRLAPGAAWSLARGAAVGLALDRQDADAYRSHGLAVVAAVGSAAEVTATLCRYADEPQLLTAHRDAARAWASERLLEPSPYADLARALRRLLDQPAPAKGVGDVPPTTLTESR